MIDVKKFVSDLDAISVDEIHQRLLDVAAEEKVLRAMLRIRRQSENTKSLLSQEPKQKEHKT